MANPLANSKQPLAALLYISREDSGNTLLRTLFSYSAKDDYKILTSYSTVGWHLITSRDIYQRVAKIKFKRLEKKNHSKDNKI
jgi:hypothetical protein